SHYRTNSMAVGIITLYGSALISATFYIKGLIGQKMWRLIHYATFVLFYAALAHGTFIGTDSERLPVQYSYLVAGTLMIFLTLFRILAARSAARPKPVAKPAPAGKLPEAA